MCLDKNIISVLDARISNGIRKLFVKITKPNETGAS